MSPRCGNRGNRDCARRRRVPAWGKSNLPKPRPAMSTCVFIQIRCKPGRTYKVAEDIALREIHSALYSTSGDYDLLMKLYIPSDEDVGKYINDHLLVIEDIERSLTTMTFKVF
jgi:DNA-binding Lrp family transcriptional regulator